MVIAMDMVIPSCITHCREVFDTNPGVGSIFAAPLGLASRGASGLISQTVAGNSAYPWREDQGSMWTHDVTLYWTESADCRVKLNVKSW